VSLATVKRRLARVSARVFASAQADKLLVQYLDVVIRRESREEGEPS
jgi:hypothetical protein